MSDLLLGPLLRYVDGTSATVWVETAAPAEVRVDVALPDGSAASGSAPTLSLHGHHFALVPVEGLPAGHRLAYTVSLDGRQAWPPVDPAWPWPASEVRTPAPGAPLRLAFGSCRRAGDDGAESTQLVGTDGLSALAHRMRAEQGAEDRWPDLLLFVGDQVYADLPTPEIVERLRARHDGTPDADPDVRDEIGDFEEYTWLYHETWGPDPVRWLLSTVPTCMLLDDHDLRDDWNTSKAWRDEVTRAPWWRDRVTGAFASYWMYQHLGNLSPDQLAADGLLAALRAAPDDGERDRLVDEFAFGADADPTSARWSFSRDLGPARLLAVDARCARQLEPGARRIADDAEWAWVREQALGADRDEPARHLLLATTLPPFVLHGIHHLEGFDEAVTDGAWGRAAVRPAEWLRQVVDLEHWSAFRASFDALVDLLREVRSMPGGTAPDGVLLLSGDVHCSYTARVRLPGPGGGGDGVADPETGDGAGDAGGTQVHQLVMSPFRNPLQRSMKLANRLLDTRGVRGFTRLLARAAGVRDPQVAWTVENGPWFDNGVMTVVLGGDGRAVVEVDHARTERGAPRLRRTLTEELVPARRAAAAPAGVS